MLKHLGKKTESNHEEREEAVQVSEKEVDEGGSSEVVWYPSDSNHQ
jgi:hypothetical protein